MLAPKVAEMRLSLLGALAAAVMYGVATVLQAVGAQRASRGTTGIDPGFVVRLARQWMYVVGLGFDALGFVFSFAALQEEPLFVVQAAVASSLAVTAVLGVWVFHARLSGGEWAGVLAVCGGLAMLGLSSASDSTPPASSALRAGLVIAALGLAVTGAAALRLHGVRRASMLGLVAGLGFGLADTSVRVIDHFQPSYLLSNPAAYAVMVAGGVALWTFASALERGSVTAATAAMVVGETVLPAGFGLIVLGESPRHGFAAVALVGFVAAVGGAVSLARFGEGSEASSDRGVAD